MYIVFDIGGTKTRIAASRDCKVFMGDPIKFDTPPNFEKGIDLMYDNAFKLTKGVPIKGIAGGIGGPLSKDKTMLLETNKVNLRDWIKRPLAETLSTKFKTPAYLANDTAIVGLGEAYAGAGMGYNIVVYITVSTGVGGVRIVNGKIAERVYGFEPGHQMIDIDNSVCKECVSGHLEDMVSGTATKHRFGVEPYDILDENLWEEELPKWLAYGVYNTILHWSPDVVVLGGSMIVGEPAISVPKTEKFVREITTIYPDVPPIKIAELGSFGGMHGGLAYLRQQTK